MAERDFRTPIEHIRSGFDRIMAGVTLFGQDQAAFFKTYVEAEWSGYPFRPQRAVDIHMGLYWRWPWLEARAAEFEQLGIWPSAWESSYPIIRPLAWDKISPAIRNELLHDALSSAMYRNRALANVTESDGFFRADLRSDRKNCPAESHFLAKYREPVLAGDYRNTPPYFPGDRIFITSIRKKRL